MASSTPLALQMTSERNGSEIMGEAQEADPVLVVTRNLLLMAINSINYIRGLFHEDYFSDMSVPALKMKTKMLMPMDAQSRKLIDWMEKGACDALQKKYLETFLFCIYEEDLILEEYAFSFSYSNTNTEEVVMSMSYTGIKKGSATFTLNSSQVTPHQMRSSACKMIRRLVSLMRTWDPMPEERTILMKLLYYNDITPDDYEPPFLKMHDDNDTTNTWYRNIMTLENVNRKHLVLLLKVKNAFQPCSNDNNVMNRVDGMSLDDEPDYNYFSNIELPKRRIGCVLVSSTKKIEFILDSGATHHICNDKTMMRNLKHVKVEDQISVYSCGGIELKAEMIGSVITKNFKLSHVGFIPGMAFNVVSIGQLASQGLLTNIADRQFSIIAVEDARMVGEGFLQKKKDRLNGTEHYEYVFRTMTWDVEGDNDTLLDGIHEGENLLEAEEWVLDTGCGRHMVPDLSILSNPKQEKLALQSASGTIWTTHKGSVKEGKLLLKDVLCCQELSRKLISVPMLDISGHRITFNTERCTVVHKDGLELKGVGLLEKHTRLYLLKADNQEENRAAKEEKNSVVAEKEDVLIDNEKKSKSMTAEKDDELTDVTAYAERMNESLTTETASHGTKETNNKRVAPQGKAKAPKRSKRQKHR